MDDGSELRSTGVVDYARDRSERLYHAKGGDTRSITIGGDVYYEYGSDEGFPAGKRWVRSAAGQDELQFEQSLADDPYGDVPSLWLNMFLDWGPEPMPNGYLDYLRQVASKPEEVGVEIVRGIATTRYRATLDLQRVVCHALEGRGWKEVNVDRYVESLEGRSNGVEAWIDAQGLTRRVVTTQTAESLGVRGNVSRMTTTEFFDFGVPVDVQAPPEGEVIEWDELPERQE